MRLILKKWLSSPLLIIILSTLLSYNFWYGYVKNHPKKQFRNDVDQYYSYLPAVFIHQDLTFQFKNRYWLIETPICTTVPKVSYGMSIMYLPGFLVGHSWAVLSDKYASDGYSYPYTIVNRLFSLLFFYLGLFVLFKCLQLYGSRIAAYFTIIALGLGTNLFFYGTTLAEMPHAYLFFLFNVIIYQSIKWHKDFLRKRLFIIAGVSGLVTIIRPTDGLILLFPFLYGIYSFESLKHKIQLIIGLKKDLIIAGLWFLLPIIPQLIYWKIYAGQWLFFSYGSDEGFFFLQPKVLEVLFSFRNGLFIYSPLLVLAICGLIKVFKQDKSLFVPIVIIFGINLYIVSCWWTWWFGGSFGARSLVQYYSLLSFGFMFLFDSFFRKKSKFLKGGLVTIVLLLGTLNIIQTIQFKRAIIHYDGMTKDVYFYVFGKLELTTEEWKWRSAHITRIDYRQAQLGNDQHNWD